MTQTKISGKFYAIQKDYSHNNRQKSFTVGEETADYSARKPDSGFTPWTWTNDGRMVRYQQNSGIVDYDSELECSDESDLERQIEIVAKVRQDLVGRSKGREKEYLQSIKNNDTYLEYLRGRLEVIRSSQLPDYPKSKTTDGSQLIPPEQEFVEVFNAEELTEDEERLRLHLERKVERAFYEAGKALQQLRDRKLYRSTHKTFEDYCKDRFGFERRHPYRLIDAAVVVDNLTPIMCPIGTQTETSQPIMCPIGTQTESSQPIMCPIGTQTESSQPIMCPIGTQTESSQPIMCPIGTQTESSQPIMCPIGTQTESSQNLRTNGTQILPTNERQVRPLTQLEPEKQRSVWQQAVQASGGKIPSGKVVKDIVRRIMEKTKVPNPFRVGEVCQIIPKDNPDLRCLGRCWGIVTHVGDFSCTVTAWDGEYTVRIDHLKLLEYTDADAEQMKKISDRLTRLRNHKNLEPAALGILSSLGELKRPYLTPFEEKLLQLTELEYEK